MVDKDLKKIHTRNQIAMTGHDVLSKELIKPTGNQANYCEFIIYPMMELCTPNAKVRVRFSLIPVQFVLVLYQPSGTFFLLQRSHSLSWRTLFQKSVSAFNKRLLDEVFDYYTL